MNDLIETNLKNIRGLDTGFGIECCNGSLNLYIRMLTKFYQTYHDYPEKISGALKNGDNDLVYRLSHTLKGISGTLGAGQVMDKAEVLEMACLENADRPVLYVYCSDLEQELNQLIKGLSILEVA